MAADLQDIAGQILRQALQGSDGVASSSSDSSSNGGSSRIKGLVAGAGAAALAPAAIGGARKLATALGVDLEDLLKSPGEAASKVGDALTSKATDKAKGALDDAGGPSGILKDAAKGMLPFGGGGGKGGAEGVGKGRRMPIQQSVDIGLPIETVYNQWTQFEDWPSFMHRVTRVSQEDDCTLSFAAKVWGKTKEFTANIETQRPNERIKWKVSEGLTHTGVVSFHELSPNLTRVMVSFDVAPGSLAEKFARGARHIKRAARADLHRFKALIETAEHETGAWRGVIEGGEVVEEHDPSYDEEREYSDIEELTDEQDSDDEGDQDEDDNGDDDEESRPRRRSQPTSGGGASKQASRGGGRKSRSGGRKSSGAKKSSGSGRSSGAKKSSSGRKSSTARKSSSGSKSSSGRKSQSRGRSRASSSSNGRSRGSSSKRSSGRSGGRSRSRNS